MVTGVADLVRCVNIRFASSCSGRCWQLHRGPRLLVALSAKHFHFTDVFHWHDLLGTLVWCSRKSFTCSNFTLNPYGDTTIEDVSITANQRSMYLKNYSGVLDFLPFPLSRNHFSCQWQEGHAGVSIQLNLELCPQIQCPHMLLLTLSSPPFSSTTYSLT